MKNKPTHTISRFTSLLLMFSLCAGIITSPLAYADSKNRKDSVENTSGNKISFDLREKIDSRNDERKHRKGEDESVNVILQIEGKVTGQLNALLNRNGVHVNAFFRNLNTFTVTLPVNAVEELAAFSEVRYVSADREMQAQDGHTSTITGADAARSMAPTGTQFDGTGIGIAVLDSGIYQYHASFRNPSYASRVVFAKDFTGENRTEDFYGHGSHVASLAAGNGMISRGKYMGSAPNANLINLRVLNSKGTGSVSAVLAAIDWVMSNYPTYNIRVANLSLGMPAIDSYRNDPICRAVRKLVDAGIVVTVAAGNNGKDSSGNKVYGMIHSPGNEPSAITVGASNDIGTIDRSDDAIATFSSRGPTRSFWTDASGGKRYDNLIKPDLVAPGNKIVGAESFKNLLVSQHPELDVRISGNKEPSAKMMRLNGTSMAAPIVAGAAALLLQANPKLTPNMVKALLMYTAQPLAGFNMLEQGAGQLNIEGAARLALLARTDLSTTAAVGAPLLTTNVLPVPRTTLSYAATFGTAYTSFSWSQGVILNRTYATGADLITKYQGMYGMGVLFGEGVLFSDGVLFGDATMLSSGIIFSDQIITSSGITMSEGAPFMSAGVLFSDGVLFGDGVIFGDGVLFSDSVLFSDGIIYSDQTMQAQSVMLYGDK